MNNKFAVIMTGGKQYLVKPGETIKIEKINAEKGGFNFDKVLLIADGDNLKIGKPFVEDEKIPVEVLGQGRGKKVVISKFKSKTRFHKKAGHRQPFTSVLVGRF